MTSLKPVFIEERREVVVGYIVTDKKVLKYQRQGTSMITRERLCKMMIEIGKDKRNFGR